MSTAESLDSSRTTAPISNAECDASARGAAKSRYPKVAEQDEASLFMVGLRDLVGASVLLSIYGGADSWARTTELGLAQCVVVVTGLFAGAAIAAMAHEWGHFMGARLAGGHAPTKRLAAFPQVFDFDYEHNPSKSFLWMSYGGSIGNWGTALLLAFALPLGITLGPDALVGGAVGFSVFTAFVEFPVIARARAGMLGWDALMLIPKDFSTRYLWQAFSAGLLVFLIL
jgi:hypothetical protein